MADWPFTMIDSEGDSIEVDFAEGEVWIDANLSDRVFTMLPRDARALAQRLVAAADAADSGIGSVDDPHGITTTTG